MTFAAAGAAAGGAVEAASVAIGVEPIIASLDSFFEGGAQGAENFTKAFQQGITSKLLLQAPELFGASYDMFKQVGKQGADDLVEGFNAVLKANVGTDFEFASSLFKQVENGTADMVTTVTSQIPLIGGALTSAFKEGKEAVDGFLGLGEEWLTSITEIGNAYIEVGRTIAATSAGENLGQLTNAVREIMATGANVFLDDVSHSIGRLNDNIHGLSMDQLKELTTTFSQAEELVGKFSPTMFSGIINAYDLSADKANETLTRLVNISRITGESMTTMMGEMTRVGPAMRNLGYDAEQTGMFFGQMVEYGERGTRLIYGMNEVAAKLNKQIVEGKAVGFSTIQGGFEQLIASVKQLHALGEDDKAKSLLGQFTTPSTAPLLFELINKGVLDAASMRKELEGINSPLVEALDQTKSLDDAVRLIGEQVKANLEPIGGVLAKGLVEAGTKITEWLAEHQSKLIGWADTITETVLTVFGKVAVGITDTLALIGPALDFIKDGVVGTLDAILEPVKLFSKGLAEAADFLGLDKFKNVFNDVAGGADTALTVLGKVGDVDISKNLDIFDRKVRDITEKGIPNLNAEIHKTAGEFQGAAEIDEAFKERIGRGGGENIAAVDIEKDPKTGTFPQDGLEPNVLRLQGTLEQQQDIARKLQEIGIMIDAGTDGVVKRITFKTDEAKKVYEEWYASQTKKSDKLEVPIQPTKDGEPVNSAQEALPDDGSSVGVPVDGGSGGSPKSFAPLPTALPYSPGSLNLPSGIPSGGSGSADLAAALRSKGISEEQIRLIQGFSATEGNNPAGNPTLGFMDRQLGGDSSLMGHVNALIKQFTDRAPVAGGFPAGGSAADQAQWIATVVGQNGASSGPDGLPQPSRSDYVNRVLTNMPAGNGGAPSGLPGSMSDAALLANVPAGRYSQDASRDLLKGLSDCSSSVGDLVNMMDSQKTGTGGNLTTGNAAQWLPAHGFMVNTTGANIPGAFNVGFNAEHMQATLPGGTNWNYGSNEAAAKRGISGGGAFDPSGGGTGAFTSHYYRLPGAWTPGMAAPGDGGAPGGAPSAPTGIPVFVTNWPGGGVGGGGGAGGGGGGGAGGSGADSSGLPSGMGPDGGPAGPRGPLPGPGGDGGLYSPENTNPALNSPPAPAGGGGGGEGTAPPASPGAPGGAAAHVNTIQVKLASSSTDLDPARSMVDAIQSALLIQRSRSLLNPGEGPSVGPPAGPYMDDNSRWRNAQTGSYTKEPLTGVDALVERVSGAAGDLSARMTEVATEVSSRFTPVAEDIMRGVESIADSTGKVVESVSETVGKAASAVSDTVAAASAEVGAAGEEFATGMAPVVDQLNADLKSAWATYVENYSKTTMGQLLTYLRDLGSRVAESAVQLASNVATATREGIDAAADIARSVASDAANMARTVVRWGANISESVAQVARNVGTALDEASQAFVDIARTVGADAVQMAQTVARAAQSAAELGRTLGLHAREASQAFVDLTKAVVQDAADMGRAVVEFAKPITVAVVDSAKQVAAVTVEQAKAVGDNIVQTTKVVTQWMGDIASGVKNFAQTVAEHASEATREFTRIAQSIGVDAVQMAQDAARIAGTIGTRVADAAVGVRDAIRAAPGIQLIEQSGKAGLDAARASFPVIDQLATRVGSWGPQIAEHVNNFATPLIDAFRGSGAQVGEGLIPRAKTISDSVMDATRAAGSWISNAARGVSDFAEPLIKTITDSKVVQVLGDAAKFGGRALALVNRFDPLGIGLSAAIEALDPYQRTTQVDKSGQVINDQLSQHFGGSTIPDHVVSALAGHSATDWLNRTMYAGSADQAAATQATRDQQTQAGRDVQNQAIVDWNRSHPTPLIPGVAAPATQMPGPGVSLPTAPSQSMNALARLQAGQASDADPRVQRWKAYVSQQTALGMNADGHLNAYGPPPPGFALGGSTAGMLPGFGGGDKIPILAEGGEFVFNKEAAAYWRDILPWMNAKKFQPGGSVGGDGGSAYLLAELQRQNEIETAAHDQQTKAQADPDIQAAVGPLKDAMDAATALLAPLQAMYDKETDFEKANDKTYAAQYADTKKSIDAYNAAVTKASASTWDLHQANVKLAEAQLKPDPKEKQASNKDSEALGHGFVKGIFQELGFGDGLDGVFGKPFTEWGITKLATGLFGYANFLGEHMGEMGPIGPQNVKPQGLFGEGANSGGGLFDGFMKGVIPAGLGGGQQQQSAGISLPSDPSLMTPALATSGAPDGGPAGPRGPAPGPAAGPQDNRTISTTNNYLAPQPVITPPASAGSRPG